MPEVPTELPENKPTGPSISDRLDGVAPAPAPERPDPAAVAVDQEARADAARQAPALRQETKVMPSPGEDQANIERGRHGGFLPGQEVNVQRTSGMVESGWRVVGQGKDPNSLTVGKPDGKGGYEATKELPFGQLKWMQGMRPGVAETGVIRIPTPAELAQRAARGEQAPQPRPAAAPEQPSVPQAAEPKQKSWFRRTFFRN